MILSEMPVYVRLFMHRYTRKALKWASLAALVLFAVHSFNTNYVIINSDGVHGVIARKTWAAIQESQSKASAYDTIPYNILNQDY